MALPVVAKLSGSRVDAKDHQNMLPELPLLPTWHTTTDQVDRPMSDRFFKAMKFPALVDAGAVCSGSRVLNVSSTTRFLPSMQMMYPTVGIQLRQNHFTGSERAKRGSDNPQDRTKYNFGAMEFAYDHIEEEFEWTLDQIEEIDVRELSAAQYTNFIGKDVRAHANRMQYVTLTFKDAQRPIHKHRRQLGAHFASGSEEEAMAQHLIEKQPRVIGILVGLTKGSTAEKCFISWKDTCLQSRSLARSNELRDDWSFARLPAYDVDSDTPFYHIVGDTGSPLPFPVHLAFDNINGMECSRPVYAANNEIARSHFPTWPFFARHVIPALLWERDESVRKVNRAFNNNLTYAAQVVRVDSTHYQFDIQLRGISSSCLPAAGTMVDIHVGGYIQSASDGNIDNVYRGRVSPVTTDDYELTVLCPVQHATLDVDTEYQVCIIFDQLEKTNIRRMESVQEVCTFDLRYRDVGISYGKPRGYLNLSTIIQDVTGALWSPPYENLWKEKYADEEALKVMAKIKAILTTLQQAFIADVLKGVFANVIILQGFPGSGKTATLAVATILLVLLGRKVLITSQSNLGVQGVIEELFKVINKHSELHFIKRRFVHLQSTRDIAQNKISDPVQVIACTSFTAGSITSSLFSVDVVIFDEAGMATDADVITAVKNHLLNGRLGLLVLAGDKNQLAPVLASRHTERNPLANILGVSILERLASEAWSGNIKNVKLVHNFRGHPGTFRMASELFYEGTMISGYGSNDLRPFYGSPAGNVFHALGEKPLKVAVPKNEDSRQYFVNVNSFCEQEENGTSLYNSGGIDAIVRLAKHLLASGVPTNKMVILTMCREDLRRMKESLKAESVFVSANLFKDYQGRQKEIVIVHFVIANRYNQDPLGHVRDQKNLCVATTRSEQFQFLVGNLSLWEKKINRNDKANQYVLGMMKWVREHNEVIEWSKIDWS